MKFIGCTLKQLPAHLHVEAAKEAIRINPANAPARGLAMPIERLAVLTSKYWGAKGVKLTVGFPFDNPEQALRSRILSHMNAWGKWGNVVFTETKTDPQVRIARTEGQGYYSYLGSDILQIPKNEPTLNLDSFTMQTPDSEFFRVVRHETGHTLGAPHEHLRKELINRLDREKTIAYFQKWDGWDRQTTIEQVLTPLADADLIETQNADANSIMCYQLPGEITLDGQPIVGGEDIDVVDQGFVAKVYPKTTAPPPTDPQVLFTIKATADHPAGQRIYLVPPKPILKGYLIECLIPGSTLHDVGEGFEVVGVSRSVSLPHINWPAILASIEKVAAALPPGLAAEVIRGLVAHLPLTPTQLAIVDALIEALLGRAAL